MSKSERNELAKLTVVLLRHYGEKMANAFSSIKLGLSEAIDFAEGRPTKAVVHNFGPLDVKKIRDQVGMFTSLPSVPPLDPRSLCKALGLGGQIVLCSCRNFRKCCN